MQSSTTAKNIVSMANTSFKNITERSKKVVNYEHFLKTNVHN